MQGSRHTSTAEGGEQIQKTQGAQGSDGEETGRGRGGLEARHRRDTTGRAGAARTGDVTGRVGGKAGQKARGQRGQRGRWGPWQWQSQRGGEGRGSWGRTGRCRQPSMVGEGHGAEGRKAGAGATANGRAGTQHAGATECYQQACEGQWRRSRKAAKRGGGQGRRRWRTWHGGQGRHSSATTRADPRCRQHNAPARRPQRGKHRIGREGSGRKGRKGGE